eukprot:6509630-Alexandrium_andersonii.AAC.1
MPEPLGDEIGNRKARTATGMRFLFAWFRQQDSFGIAGWTDKCGVCHACGMTNGLVHSRRGLSRSV